MEAHHGEVEPRTVEAVIVQAADAVSGQPGARGDALEQYVSRLRDLERSPRATRASSACSRCEPGADPRGGRSGKWTMTGRLIAHEIAAGEGDGLSGADQDHRDPREPLHVLRQLSE